VTLAAASITGAQTAPITFAYTGTVTVANGGTAFDAFLGQTVTMQYTFESTTADATPGDPAEGTYSGAISALSRRFRSPSADSPVPRQTAQSQSQIPGSQMGTL
jgi:hypothetical protein